MVTTISDPFTQTLAEREKFRERYQREKDPICADRLSWRAQTFRHMVHLLPGQTILEIGSGDGAFVQQLWRVSRGQNPITAVTFACGSGTSTTTEANVESIEAASF